MSSLKKQVYQHKPFSSHDARELINLFFQLTGNKIGFEKSSMIESRLSRRLRELHLDISEYADYVRQNESEKEIFIDKLTTHKTEWFRESVHFDFFKMYCHKHLNNPLFVWCAASSTGEEVYGIILTALRAGMDLQQIKILASDVSSKCLKATSDAIYIKEELRAHLSINELKMNFNDTSEHEVQVRDELKRQVKVRKFNLLLDLPKAENLFQFIFLRNVLIYFDADQRIQIISRLAKALVPGGHLILGLSEALPSENQTMFERIQTSVYRKKGT